jgi:hypothetical protein
MGAQTLSSTSHFRKILGVALILVVVCLAGVGSYFTFNKPTSPFTVTSMSSGTTATSSTQTTQSETANTTVVPVQWITIGQPKSVNYYLSLVESNGTTPYVQLASELKQLPDLQNATAVAQITYLALNATNPEVKEAFQLMMNGGTPSQSDYSYPVPIYNTELEILYWLACQNEFKKDDTLALSISMVNGLWVTVGDDQVVEAVRNDTNAMLRFGREMSEWQRGAGFSYSLEDYPLEAKIAWAWTGTTSTLQGPFGLIRYSNYREAAPRDPSINAWPTGKFPIQGYNWSHVSVQTLKEIRDYSMQRSDLTDVNEYIETWEKYFFGGYMAGRNTANWSFVTWPNVIANVSGVDVRDGGVLDVQYQMQRILAGQNPIGDCGAESALMDAFAKAVGIASVVTWRFTFVRGYQASDDAMAYYDPQTHLWRIYPERINQDMLGHGDILPSDVLDYWVYKPPVILPGFLSATPNTPLSSYTGKMFFVVRDVKDGDFNSMWIAGVPTSQMKQWLLYMSSGSPSTVESSMMFSIDGYGRDWGNFKAIMSKGATQSVIPGRDLQAVYAVADGTYLYIMIKLYAQPDPGNSYIILLNVTGTGKWDYSFGFNNNSVWMYDLRGIPNGQWPDSRLSTPCAIYAVAAVAEIAIPLETIGNPTKIYIADVWVNSNGETVDQFGHGGGALFITNPTSTTTSSVSEYAATTTETSSTNPTSARATLRLNLTE